MLSVIVPVYNNESYIGRCLDSLISQKLKNIEIIVVNDGSTDESLKICKQYRNKDSRISIITQANNGVSAARNSGLNYATGKYIGFVDSDDYISDDMYEKLVNAAEENASDIAEIGVYIVDSRGQVLSEKLLKESVLHGPYECTKEFLLNKNSTNYTCNKIYLNTRKRFSDFKYSEDYYFNYNMHIVCKKKVTLSSQCYYYVQHAESTTSSTFSTHKFDSVIVGKIVLEDVLKRYPKLAVIVVNYILGKVRSLYLEIKKDSKASGENVKYKKNLIEEYNSIFDRWIFNYLTSVQGITFKQKLLSLLFRFNPNLF